MLEPLDKSNIPNFANIMDKFKSSEYDPGSKYSVPYTWGTVGIIYDTTVVDEEDIGWDILWDEDYSGRIFITSVYLLAYSGIDIFISKIWRNLKKSGK